MAKLYRAYASELVALTNGYSACAEISVVGDCVSGIFSTPQKDDIDSTFSAAARISSLIDIFNYKSEQKARSPYDENELEIAEKRGFLR